MKRNTLLLSAGLVMVAMLALVTLGWAEENAATKAPADNAAIAPTDNMSTDNMATDNTATEKGRRHPMMARMHLREAMTSVAAVRAALDKKDIEAAKTALDAVEKHIAAAQKALTMTKPGRHNNTATDNMATDNMSKDNYSTDNMNVENKSTENVTR